MMSRAKVYFLEGGRESVTLKDNDSKANNVVRGVCFWNCNEQELMSQGTALIRDNAVSISYSSRGSR